MGTVGLCNSVKTVKCKTSTIKNEKNKTTELLSVPASSLDIDCVGKWRGKGRNEGAKGMDLFHMKMAKCREPLYVFYGCCIIFYKQGYSFQWQ